MLTGAARRATASCGSLLIAAVPSSPIEKLRERLMTMLTGAHTKTSRGACQRVKRDVGRGQQESRRRARPRRSRGRAVQCYPLGLMIAVRAGLT